MLSFTEANAPVWPCAARAVPRARRCESICISVAVDAAAAFCVAIRPSMNTIRAENTKNITIITPST